MTQPDGSTRIPKKSPAMTVIINRQLFIEWADASALAYFGKDIVGRPCHETLCAETEPCSCCVVRKCFENHRSQSIETKMIVHGNHRRILRRTASPAEFKPDDALQYVKEIIEDITPTRLFENTMQAVRQQVTLKNGQVFFEALALKLCKLLKAREVFIATFDPEHSRAQTIAVALNGELAPNFNYPLPSCPCNQLLDTPLLWIQSAAAERYPQCDWLREPAIKSYLGVQVKDRQGKPLGLIAALFRKTVKDPALIEDLATMFSRPVSAALEQLVHRRTMDKYRHITATSNDLLALLDHECVHQIVNRAYTDFHGLTNDRIVGRTMSEIFGPEFFESDIRPVTDACLLGRQGHLQVWLPGPTQSRRCLDMAFYPHYEKGANRIKGFVLCAKDITRSKKLEADLRQSAKMEAIGRLAGGIVHDFNNILGAVVGYTDLALSIVQGQPEVTKYLREIQQAGLRATELAKQILSFSRQSHEVRKPIQPKVVLEEAMSLLRATIPADIRIRMNLASAAYVLADNIHLHQIVINLCTNSQHAMREHGGTFSVGLEDLWIGSDNQSDYPGLQPGPYIRMSFTDTGPGIPEDIQAKMFNPFFTTKGKGEGTGMGLTMVNSIVKSYEGQIDLHSEVGRGTTIGVLLPAIEVDKQPLRAEPAVLPQGQGQRILVVDDQHEIAQVTATMLTSLGYSAQTLTDSRSALELFKSDPQAFDLVISDVTMPGLKGDALARQIIGQRPDLPVLLMTGHSDRVNHELIRAIGVKRMLLKPLSLDALAVALSEVLKKET